MIRYREYYPSSKFRNIISCFWTMGFEPGAQLPERDVVLPDGCTDLLINTGPSFKRIDGHMQQEFQIKEYALIGQRQNAIEISQSSQTTFFAIRFTPFGMRSLIPLDSSDLTGKILEEDKTLKRLVEPIRLILGKKVPFHEKLQIIEHVLEKRLIFYEKINPIVEKATLKILHTRGKFNVTSFCIKSNIHKSTLEKNFLAQVGLRPKELAAIIRFNHAHAILRSEKKVKLTHLAIDCGYYDQSHMIKEFRRFSNSSPSKFMKAKYLLPDIAVSCHQSLKL